VVIEEMVVVDVLGVLSTSTPGQSWLRETMVEKIMWGDSIIITVSLQAWQVWELHPCCYICGSPTNTEPGGKGTRQRWRFLELAPYRSHNTIGSFSAAPNDLDAQIQMF